MVSRLKCTVKQWLLAFIYKSLFPSYMFCNQYLYRSGLKVTQNEDEVYIEKSNYYKGYFNGRGQKHKTFENTFPDVLNISWQNRTLSKQITLIVIIGLFLFEVWPNLIQILKSLLKIHPSSRQIESNKKQNYYGGI